MAAGRHQRPRAAESRSWTDLYYGPNYPRLQQVKARWDPRNVFQHELSVQPPHR
ncbi:BBE domain-containing protein [Micromonospora sp. NPDC005173]|uniref:BBE domain-containing protein n=1 Tax=Micromonospora sp. NPDC005173 TaxID=3157165 RepID=UPI0033BA1C49